MWLGHRYLAMATTAPPAGQSRGTQVLKLCLQTKFDMFCCFVVFSILMVQPAWTTLNGTEGKIVGCVVNMRQMATQGT